VKYLRLLVFITIAFIPSVSGVVVQTGEWYALLVKPPLNPPGWIFGPVWTALYLLIGISGWLAWEGKREGKGIAFTIFCAQLVLNALWTVFFFGLHQPLVAFADLVLLWIFILLNIIVFWKIRPLAGFLLLPYLAWVSFAGYLNFALWLLNKT